jgi:hypothetical protein
VGPHSLNEAPPCQGYGDQGLTQTRSVWGQLMPGLLVPGSLPLGVRTAPSLGCQGGGGLAAGAPEDKVSLQGPIPGGWEAEAPCLSRHPVDQTSLRKHKH